MQTVPLCVDVHPGDVDVRFSVTGNPVTGVLPRCGVMSIVMLCVDADTYAGVRACAPAAEPAGGIVILRFVVVEVGPAGAELLRGGTACPAPPAHAAKPATSNTGKQRFISVSFGPLLAFILVYYFRPNKGRAHLP